MFYKFMVYLTSTAITFSPSLKHRFVSDGVIIYRDSIRKRTALGIIGGLSYIIYYVYAMQKSYIYSTMDYISYLGLIVIGFILLASALMLIKSRIEIDPKLRRLTITRINFFHFDERIVAFEEVSSLELEYRRARSNDEGVCKPALKLITGEIIPLSFQYSASEVASKFMLQELRTDLGLAG